MVPAWLSFFHMTDRASPPSVYGPTPVTFSTAVPTAIPHRTLRPCCRRQRNCARRSSHEAGSVHTSICPRSAGLLRTAALVVTLCDPMLYHTQPPRRCIAPQHTKQRRYCAIPAAGASRPTATFANQIQSFPSPPRRRLQGAEDDPSLHHTARHATARHPTARHPTAPHTMTTMHGSKTKVR